MNPEDISKPKHLYTVRYTMKQADVQAFVAELHAIQSDMIEELVAQEQRKGFPQVKEILDSLAR